MAGLNKCMNIKNMPTLHTGSFGYISRNLLKRENVAKTRINCDQVLLTSTRTYKLLTTKPKINNLPLTDAKFFIKFKLTDTYLLKSFSSNATKEGKKFLRSGGYIIFGVAAATMVALYQLIIRTDIQELEKLFMNLDKKTYVPVSRVTPLEEIPDYVEYLIVGGGTTAFSAGRTIKSNDPDAKILLISEELDYPYMRPPLSKELFKPPPNKDLLYLEFAQWNGSIRSIFFESEEFYVPCKELIESKSGGIAVARGWKVISIDPTNKVVKLKDGKEIKYVKCLIATGSTPIKLNFVEFKPETIRNKVSYYSTLTDYKQLSELVDDGNKKVIGIYGSGLLATELACSLSKTTEPGQLKIVQFIGGNNVMTDYLPLYLCSWLTRKIESEGIRIFRGANIIDIKLKDERLHLIMSDGSKAIVDHIIVCLGCKPNTDIAKASGLEVDEKKGGFVVNSELLARSDLYAAGDCASYYDLLTGKRLVVTHYDHAITSGQAAAENMSGKGLAKPFKHHAGFWTEFCAKIGFEAVGNIDPNLRTIGFFSPSTSSSSYYQKTPNGVTKGVIFYLNEENVVEGVILWNMFNQINIARQVVASREVYDNLTEVVKHFDLFSDHKMI